MLIASGKKAKRPTPAAKPPKIASIVWPASMLANNRIESVNGRMK